MHSIILHIICNARRMRPCGVLSLCVFRLSKIGGYVILSSSLPALLLTLFHPARLTISILNVVTLFIMADNSMSSDHSILHPAATVPHA